MRHFILLVAFGECCVVLLRVRYDPDWPTKVWTEDQTRIISHSRMWETKPDNKNQRQVWRRPIWTKYRVTWLSVLLRKIFNGHVHFMWKENYVSQSKILMTKSLKMKDFQPISLTLTFTIIKLIRLVFCFSVSEKISKGCCYKPLTWEIHYYDFVNNIKMNFHYFSSLAALLHWLSFIK